MVAFPSKDLVLVGAPRDCTVCKTQHSVLMTEAEYQAFQSGARMQDALPNHTVDQREILISGLCAKAWDELMG